MKHLFLVLFSLGSIGGYGQDATHRIKEFNLDNGVGTGGYDPVAYFTQNEAVKGHKELSVFHEGVTYYFSTVANKDEFTKNPSKYEPQYGGWCAYAMGSEGTKVEVDPETFKVMDGKLFLFYNRFFNNTLKSWNKNEATLHQQADANWKKFYH